MQDTLQNELEMALSSIYSRDLLVISMYYGLMTVQLSARASIVSIIIRVRLTYPHDPLWRRD